MSLYQSGAERLVAGKHQLLERVDSVYFLPFPDWEKELRSNRWHFAARWARVKPVVMVNPILGGGRSRSVAEPRIPNMRILRVRSLRQTKLLAARQIQIGQVLADMSEHHYERPLLWSYNPGLVHVLAGIPAVARVHHATEAFFDMPDVNQEFLHRLSAMVTISDITIAVSEGVAAGLRRHVPGADVVTVANGCDYHHYSAGKPDAELQARAGQFRRIAVYAGNVNDRVDFTLLNGLAERHADVLFAVYGPRSLSRQASLEWQRLVGRANVFAPGAIDPDRLRDVYAAADVGLIPYRQDPWLVENGLPLKALEMCATGLPVVSSLMKSLVGMADALVVTRTPDEFMSAFERTSRAKLTPREAAQLAAVSSANDYDVKFEEALTEVDRCVTSSRAATRVDHLIEVLGPEWFSDEERFGRWLAMSPAGRVLEWTLNAVARVVPEPVKRRLIPDRLRAAAQQIRGS